MKNLRKSLLIKNSAILHLTTLIIFASLLEMGIVYIVYSKITLIYASLSNGNIDLEKAVYDSFIILSLLIIKAGSIFYTQWSIYRVAFNEYAEKSAKIFSTCLSAIDDGINEISANQIFSILNTELEKYFMNYVITSLIAVSEVIIILSLSFLLISQNIILSLTLLLVFLLTVVTLHFVTRPVILRLGEERLNAERHRVNWLKSGFEARTDIIIFDQISEFSEQITNYSKQLGKAWASTVGLSNLPKTSIELALFLFLFVYVSLVIYFKLELNNIIPFLALLGMVGLRILPSVNRLVVSLQHRNYYTNLAKELTELYDIKLRQNSGYRENASDEIIATLGLKIVLDGHKISTRNFSINKPGLYRINGASGSGKSSLLITLIKLYQRFEGSVHYKKGIKISYVAQYPMIPIGNLSQSLGLTEQNAEELQFLLSEFQLGGVDIEESLHKSNGNFSGGEVQRLAIIRAFLNNPDVVFLDEYFSALDPENAEKIHDFIVRESKKRAIIFTSHKPPEFEYHELNLFEK